MPVPTETFRNMKKLNLVFAASSVLLLMSLMGLVLEDWNREWRQFQKDGLSWQAAMVIEARDNAQKQETMQRISSLAAEVERLNGILDAGKHDELGGRTIAAAEADIAEREGEIASKRLPAAVLKGEIGPIKQQIERLKFAGDEAGADKLRKKLTSAETKFKALDSDIIDNKTEIKNIQDGLKVVREKLKSVQKERDNIVRVQESAKKKLSEVQPSGMALIGKEMRNAPGLDWINPSEKPYQQVVPDVLTDYNTMQVETIDRCQTCHINIDKPQFAESNLVAFVERQIAFKTQPTFGGDVDPVVMVDFWMTAAKHIGAPLARAMNELEVEARAKIDARLAKAGLGKLAPDADLLAELKTTAGRGDGDGVKRTQWYQVVREYRDALRGTINKHIESEHGKESVDELNDLYRTELINRYNGLRQGAPLSSNPVLLAHPNLERFVGPESPHPMTTMGCTVCHEGSGQETIFEHTVHSPREMWVDKKTGAPVPLFLVKHADNGGKMLAGKSKKHAKKVTNASREVSGSAAAAPPAKGATYSHHDVNIVSPGKPAPLSPNNELHIHGHTEYTNPATGATATAIPQVDYWTKHYHWHHVHYAHWEKPMHSKEFVESSCLKCHKEVYDLKDAAPTLYQGRTLFTQLGCVNCHDIDQIANGMDIKQVGPSLVHVKNKLTPQMMANWIWAPKAFRPSSRMPHYFMLENNSTPADILRTRTEVAAMSFYLQQAYPGAESTYRLFYTKLALISKRKGEIDAEKNELDDEKKKDGTSAERKAEIDKAVAGFANEEESIRGKLESLRTEMITALEPDVPVTEKERKDLNMMLDQLWDRVPTYNPEKAPDSKKMLELLANQEEQMKKLVTDTSTPVEKAASKADLEKLAKRIGWWKNTPTGDAERGAELFKSIGCLSCHVNMNEHGQQWATGPLASQSSFAAQSFADDLYEAVDDDTARRIAVDYAQSLRSDLLGRVIEGDKADTIRAEIGKIIAVDLKNEKPIALPKLEPLTKSNDALRATISVPDLTKDEPEAIKTLRETLVAFDGDALAEGVKQLVSEANKKTPEATAIDVDAEETLTAAIVNQINRAKQSQHQTAQARVYELTDKWLKPFAQLQYQAMSYNQQHSYVLLNATDKLAGTGPELSGIGSKLLAGRAKTEDGSAYTAEAMGEARVWLYDWLRNPRRYHSYTVMPSFRMSPEETLDMAAYLLTQRRPGTDKDGKATKEYTLSSFLTVEKNRPKLDKLNEQMMGELVISLLASKTTRSIVEKRMAEETVSNDDPESVLPFVSPGRKKWNSSYQLYYLGKKMVQHYGCNGCHQINGFETAGSACAKLDDWGLKDPHKLDFGYFDHAFDKQRLTPARVWKTRSEGLADDAIHVNIMTEKAEGTDDKDDTDYVPDYVARDTMNIAVTWETMQAERRPWLYHKLHNPRVFNRGASSLDGDEGGEIRSDDKGNVDITRSMNAARPYDKLKMPKFHMTDEQARAIVTFVTAVRKPLVRSSLQTVANKAGTDITRGRQVATRFNCYGCHDIEGNDVNIRQFYDIIKADGSTNYEVLWDQSPPRLIGQGAKTQPEWLVFFLQNVHKVRPTTDDGAKMEVRMPSFPITTKEATALADYFAGWSQNTAKKLEKVIAPIEKQIAARNVEKERLENRLIDLKKQKATATEKKDQDRLDKHIKGVTRDLDRLNDFNRDWYNISATQSAVEKLKQFAYMSDLTRPAALEGSQPLFADADEEEEWFTARREAFNTVLEQSRFLHDTYDIDHPFPAKRRAAINEDRFQRGLKLFNELKCAQCHPLGDDETVLAVWMKQNPNFSPGGATTPAEEDPFGEEEDDPFGEEEDDPFGENEAPPAPAAAAPTRIGPPFLSPNLNHIATRLQWNWVDKWLQKSLTMMPGTKMPQWWPHGEAETADLLTKLPPKMRKDMEAIYGRTGPAQRQILMDFMYAAAQRNYSPGEELVTGMIRPKIELAALPTQDTGNQRPQLKLDVDNGGDDPDGGGEVVVAKTVIKTKSDIELHEGEQPWTGKAGTGRVIGVVRFDGDRPGRSVITGILGNPFCAAKNTPPKRSERIVVTKKGEVQHMLVHVKSGLPDQKWTAPKTPVVLDQIDCIYVPHVVSVMPGQPIVIPNSDATSHNVLMTSGKNGTTNESMPVKDMKLNKKMKKPELNISFKCSVHPWMNARLHVLPHPFHMVSDVEGRFEITGLPPGKYTLEAYHETAGDAKGSVKPVTFDVEVKADTSTRADVTVKAE